MRHTVGLIAAAEPSISRIGRARGLLISVVNERREPTDYDRSPVPLLPSSDSATQGVSISSGYLAE